LVLRGFKSFGPNPSLNSILILDIYDFRLFTQSPTYNARVCLTQSKRFYSSDHSTPNR